MEFRGKNEQHRPPSHSGRNRRTRTQSGNSSSGQNSLEFKKNAKNQSTSCLKDQQTCQESRVEERPSVSDVVVGQGMASADIVSHPARHSSTGSRMSVGDTPTPTRTDDGDADSYYDAESGLCSPAPPIKPQVTIHVEKSMDVDETPSDAVNQNVAASKTEVPNVESVGKVASPSNPMHKRHSKQLSSNGSDKKMNKLCRSNAFQDEDASPEPPVDLPQEASHIEVLTKNMSRLSASGRHGLLNQKSSSMESGSLSRGSSTELYTDSSGINLQEFFTETLKQVKSRSFLLSTEKEMLAFVQDVKLNYYTFEPHTSYHRMLIHRVAAFFGLDHNIDKRTDCITVNKTPNTRIPDFKFESVLPPKTSGSKIGMTASDSISDDHQLEPKKLLRRKDGDEKSQSLDKSPDCRSNNNNNNNSNGQPDKNGRSKSYEERQVRYEHARSRIFNSEMSTSSEVEPGSLCNTANSSGIDVSCPGLSGNPPMTASSSLRSSQEDDLMRISSVEKPWSSVESDSSSRLHRQPRTERSLDLENQRRSHLLHPDYKSASTESSTAYAVRGGYEFRGNRRGIPKASSFEGTKSASAGGSATNYRKTNSLNSQVTQSNDNIPHKKEDSSDNLDNNRSIAIEASSGGAPLLPKPNLVHQSSAPNTGSRAPPPVRQSSWQHPRWQNQQTGHHHFSGNRSRYPRGNFNNHSSSPSHHQYHHPGMQQFPPPSTFMSPTMNPVLPPIPGSYWVPSPDMMRPPSGLFYYQTNTNMKEMGTDQPMIIPPAMVSGDPNMYPGMYLLSAPPSQPTMQAAGPSPTFTNPKEPQRNSSSDSSSGSFSGRQSQPMQSQPQQQQPIMPVQMPQPAVYYVNTGQGPQLMYVTPSRNQSSSSFVQQPMQVIPSPQMAFLAPSPTGQGAPGGPSPGLLPLPSYPFPPVSPQMSVYGSSFNVAGFPSSVDGQESPQSVLQPPMSDQSYSPYMNASPSGGPSYGYSTGSGPSPSSGSSSFPVVKGSSPDTSSSPTPPHHTMSAGSSHVLSGYPICVPNAHSMAMNQQQQFCSVGTNSSQSGPHSMQPHFQSRGNHSRGHGKGATGGGNFRSQN